MATQQTDAALETSVTQGLTAADSAVLLAEPLESAAVPATHATQARIAAASAVLPAEQQGRDAVLETPVRPHCGAWD